MTHTSHARYVFDTAERVRRGVAGAKLANALRHGGWLVIEDHEKN